jgi:membrane fusion protein, multidrug efflux system
MRSLILQMALCAALVGAGCGSAASDAPVTNAAAPPPASMTPAPTEIADARLTVSGPIIVEHQVDVTAQRDGVLAKILFDAPARVKAGTVLASMDDRQIAANLEAARAKSRGIAADLKNWEADTEVLKADYGRAQHLWDLGLISEEQLQHAKYKVESDQWDIKRVQETLNTAHQEERSLEFELEKMRITAPFDGLIARRYVREGQSVSKGDRLFWVTEESPLLMRFTLPERFFGRVRSAQQFEITSPDVPGEKHAARIKEISPVVDPASGTFEVLVQLVGNRGSLRPGMTANLQVDNPR